MPQAEAIQERDEAERLADTAQGDVRVVEIYAGLEDTVQAVVQEFESCYNALLVFPVLLTQVDFALAGDMFGVAAEGGGAEAVLGAQGAVRDSGQQTAINVNAGGMIADGTALYHT
jgi:hypothetical protein